MQDELQQLEAHLRFCQALAIAAQRAPELFELLHSSEDPEAAVARLTSEWRLDEEQAWAVLDSASRKYTARERAKSIRRVQRLEMVLREVRDMASSPPQEMATAPHRGGPCA
jgi:DNA gyrase/topoisomerase IV subunit A